MYLEITIMNTNEEREPLRSKEQKSVTSPQVTTVYKRRWYILGIFCYSAIIQATIWNTWGPIAESTKILFGWTDSNIALVTNLSNVSFCVMVIPASMFMDKKGLRFSLIVCSIMLIVATGLRCITSESMPLLYLSYSCALIFGMAAIVPFAGPSLVSAVWFPPDQRTTATALASTFNYLGFALSFLLGPLIVTNPEYAIHEKNKTCTFAENTISTATDSKLGNQDDATEVKFELTSPISEILETKYVVNIDSLKSGTKGLVFVYLGMSSLLFILAVVYFPPKPPRPLSYTAFIERPHYRKAAVQLMKNRNLWLVVIAGGLPLGVLSCWAAILDVNLAPIGVKQTDAGWIGFWHIISGCISGLITARFSDIFMHRRKLFLIGLYVMAAASCVWFTMLYNNCLSFDLASVCASCILLGLFANATIPLFYEVSCEASYPVPEGLTGGFYTLMMNLFGTLFLFMLNIENIGVVWMNWALLGSLLISIPILIIFPERLKRTDIDIIYSGK